MRLAIHVPGRFHARTEPWRYEDFPAQHRPHRDVKFFGVWMTLDCLFISRKGRKGETETETETIPPLRRYAPRPPVSEGQLVSAVFLL